MNVTIFLHLVPKIIMSGAIAPLGHDTSWRSYVKLYLNFKLNNTKLCPDNVLKPIRGFCIVLSKSICLYSIK